MKTLLFVLFYGLTSVGIGIVLPIYLLHTKKATGFFSWDILAIAFIIGTASFVDVFFFSQYKTWIRLIAFIVVTVASLFLAVLLIHFGYIWYYGEKPVYPQKSS